MTAKLNPRTPVTIPAEEADRLARIHFRLVELRHYRNTLEASDDTEPDELADVIEGIGILTERVCYATGDLLSAADYVIAPEVPR